MQCNAKKQDSTCACPYTPSWYWKCLGCYDEATGDSHCSVCDLDYVKMCETCGYDEDLCTCKAFQG